MISRWPRNWPRLLGAAGDRLPPTAYRLVSCGGAGALAGPDGYPDRQGCWVEGRWVGREQYQRGAPPEQGPAEIYEPEPEESNAATQLPPLGWFAKLKGPSRVAAPLAADRDPLTELADRLAEHVPHSKIGSERRAQRALGCYLDDRLAGVGVPRAEFDWGQVGQPVRAGSGPRARDIGQLNGAQQLVWDRSLAFVAPVGRGDEHVAPSWSVIGDWNDISPDQARNGFADAMRWLWYIANTEETVSGGEP